MAYYNATRQSLFTLCSLSCEMNAICSRCVSELQLQLPLALFSFYGFSLDSPLVRWHVAFGFWKMFTHCNCCYGGCCSFFLFLFLLFSNCKYALEFLWHRQVYLYNIQARFLLATLASILYTLDIPLARSVLDYDVDLPHTSCVSFDLLSELKIKISSCTDSAGVPHCSANYCEYEDE